MLQDHSTGMGVRVQASVGPMMEMNKIGEIEEYPSRGPINRRCARYIGTYGWLGYFVHNYYWFRSLQGLARIQGKREHRLVILSASEGFRRHRAKSFAGTQSISTDPICCSYLMNCWSTWLESMHALLHSPKNLLLRALSSQPNSKSGFFRVPLQM